MIVGVGLDVVEIGRFRLAMKRQGRRLLDRTFTPGERRYCDAQRDPAPHYAARFAAKEAVLKALGTGWSGGIRWTDVEVVRGRSGPATVRLGGRAKRRGDGLRVGCVHLSLTHTEGVAAAVAVAESATPRGAGPSARRAARKRSRRSASGGA